jgi:hypothetical protein
MPLNPIEEIRATRVAIMRKFDGDVDKYCDHLEEKWKDSGLNVVAPKPKRIKARPVNSTKLVVTARKIGKEKPMRPSKTAKKRNTRNRSE